MKPRAWLFLSGSLPALVIASIAQAAEPAGSSGGGIEEVVVTATKREQSLQKVGLTVSAISAEALSKQRIASVADLAQVTPGLAYAPSPNATPVYTIRGVGFFESSLAAYPDVSLYIDQAPLPFPVLASRAVFDLERVETLKGPQGTLFGNNATGGAINFIAAKPTKEFHAGTELSYGRFNDFQTNSFISGPITQKVAARLAVRTENGDEWQKSYSRDDKNGKRENYAGRLIVDVNPSDALKLSFNLNGWIDKDDTQAPQKLANSPQNPPGGAGFGGIQPNSTPPLDFPASPHNARAADWTPDLPFGNNKFWQVGMRGDWEINSYLTLTSITSYANLSFENGTEGGATPFLDLDIANDKGKIATLSQELRLASDPTRRFRWVVGGNYENSSVDEVSLLLYKDTTSTPINGISISVNESHQTMKNYAGFGNLEFDIVDKLTLKGGVRVTNAQRRSENLTRDDPQYPPQSLYSLQQFFNLVYGFIYGGAVPPIGPYQSISLNTNTLTAGTFFGSLNEHNTSFSAGLDYKPTDNFLIYLNFSKGYKAGNFPQVSAAVFDAYHAVTQESLMDYEVGVKTQWFNNRLQINAAAFYYEYQDKQLRAKFVDPIFGALDKLVNVPQSTVKGGEIDVTAYPIDGLTLSFAAVYLDAEVSKYDGVVGSFTDAGGLRRPILASFTGVRLPFAPEFQYNFRADYDFPISNNLNAFVGAGINGQTKSIGILTTSAAERDLYNIRDRMLVNLNAGIRSSDDRWRVSVWGKNVFDTYYWSNTIQAYDTIVRYAGMPAEYGVTVGFKF